MNQPNASSGVSQKQKSTHAEREERVLAGWKEKGIFEKSLAKASPKGEFVFYEGPPTANGRPGIHHLEARAFKDAIPRYKTMRGFHVRRKGGWDTHGLPVELQVEKELGLKSKKEIETYGIAAFNEKCKESVWTYVHEWEEFTARMGYWVDLKDPYITYKPAYIESLWSIMKEVDRKGLLYKDYKVVPWCPRCGTALSSHELAQGYADVKDLSVYVKFTVKGKENTFLLAWTTTPWTLPGNVALAVGKDIEYVEATSEGSTYILAKRRFEAIGSLFKDSSITATVTGKDLVGLEYEPLYPFLNDTVSGAEKDKLPKAYKVYAADFVTTEDGTGIVHTAVMYGQDDFVLGTEIGLPKYHLVNEDGTFKPEAGFLAGKFVKDEATDVEIIKDLAHRGYLFHKEKHTHSYPFCWRCKTPLIYFARDSWYIRMSELRQKLVTENEGVHWEPGYIKEGRFGEWLRDVKDWAISRERYWGTPLPVWACGSCAERRIVGSIDDLKRKPKNSYFLMRHGEAEHNAVGILNSDPTKPYHLTQKGKDEVRASAAALKGKIDLIYASPFLRAQETARIVAETVGIPEAAIITDESIREMGLGELEGKPVEEFRNTVQLADETARVLPGGIESRISLKMRTGAFLERLERERDGKRILIVAHDAPLWMMTSAAKGLDIPASLEMKRNRTFYLDNAEARELSFDILPHNSEYELDLHRPYIDEVVLPCSCGGEMKRVREVMDVWFDSGAMPFAQDHYLFGKKKDAHGFDPKGGLFHKSRGYPADFISEAIDQTRGWFYTLHAIGTLMGTGKAYKNVICLGHILDAQGKKMSKSVGNVVNPWEMMDAYGADALRFWMYSVNQPGESKNFEEKTVDEIVKKVFNLAGNVLSFYKMYAHAGVRPAAGSAHILDRWIVARLDELIRIVTSAMDAYVFLEPTRAIRDFISDLSQWYLRRSRDRFKEDGQDKQAALSTTAHVLLTLSKVMAPFAPFFAESMYAEAGGLLESVHLESWPEPAGKPEPSLVSSMEHVRSLTSRGLEARMAAKINVRQPLAKLSVGSPTPVDLSSDLVELIKNEINVKEVAFVTAAEETVNLDTFITPELKEEGELRELVRSIQDMRKEKGLSVGDPATLVVPADQRRFVDTHFDLLAKAASLRRVETGDVMSLKV